MVTACHRDGVWHWGGRRGSNSISDAEQLLCLLYPATEIPGLALDRPDDTAEDVLGALSGLTERPPGEDAEDWLLEPSGPAAVVGEAIVGLIENYHDRYTKSDGTPDFSGGDYLRSAEERPVTEEQRRIDVVDSFSMSLTLCIAALGFLRVFRGFVRAQTYPEADELLVRIDELSGRVSQRLTAAMIGLVRSFIVHPVRPNSEVAETILTTMGQRPGRSKSALLENLIRALDPIRSQLRSDVTLGQPRTPRRWRDDMLFECGWTWGVADDSGELPDFPDHAISAQPGRAVRRPYLYFTIVALDGINDLTSQRTRRLDLLDDQQRRLAESLQTRWHLTQQYWSTLARFGDTRWPLEDIPWRTSDGEESDYFSALVSAVLIQDLVSRAANEDDLTRAVDIFDELAKRGRITRRAVRGDAAVDLHSPGVPLRLRGTESQDAPLLEWMVGDYATVLLKRVLQAARLSGEVGSRDRLLELAKAIMDHLENRKIAEGPAAGLWDSAARVFPTLEPSEKDLVPSWYFTERMIECLITADRTFRALPLRPPSMVGRAVELLSEAEHLLNQEWLNVSLDDISEKRQRLEDIEQRLDRARDLVDDKPGTAVSITTLALADLDELSYARLDATRSV